MSLSRSLSFGGCVLGLESSDGTRISVPKKYSGFLSDQEPELVLQVHRGSIPSHDWGDIVFAPDDSNWRLYQRDGQATIVCGPDAEAVPRRVLALNWKRRRGDLYIADPDPRHFAYPLAYPLEEALMVRLLARGRGVLLHAFAMEMEGAGYLFVGRSGAGKSTLADLWEEEDVALLSDDRVIVRRHASRFHIYGTPWHGDARVLSSRRAPLERVFIIEHGRQNAVRKLRASDAVTRLLVRSFPPFGDPEGMAFTLDFLGDLVGTVPCHGFRFVADQSSVEYLRCLLST